MSTEMKPEIGARIPRAKGTGHLEMPETQYNICLRRA